METQSSLGRPDRHQAGQQTGLFTKLINFGVVLLAFLAPLFFLPLTLDFYNFNKQVLVIIVTMLLLVLWILKSWQQKGFVCKKTPFNLPLIAFAVIFLVSSLVQSPNKVAALLGRTSQVLSLTILYFLIVNNFSKKTISWVLTALFVSSAVLVWTSIFSFVGLFEQLNLPWDLVKNQAWNPTGSPLILLTFLTILLPATLYLSFTKKGPSTKILLFVASTLQIVGIILTVSLFITKKADFVYLRPDIGWSIAVDGFKTVRTALLGFGPENFVSAFLRFRPAIFNQTKFWAFRFTANSNEYFNVLSITGILGLLAYIFLVLRLAQSWQKSKKTKLTKALFLSLALSFVGQLIIPVNFLMLMTTFVLLGCLSVCLESEEEVYFSLEKKKTFYLGILIASLFGGISIYATARVWQADYYFTQSLMAAAENKGGLTYNLQIKAIQLNPFAENYRIVYADTCLALANNLASPPTGGPTGGLTDQDQSNIQQLVAQSIREAKAAVALNWQNSANWEHLANIYRNLINFAQGADQWTITSYAEALRNNPTDPLLRVNVGGLFYAMKDYDRAILQFVQATALKPDYANGYYNLAATYREKGEYQKAFENMQMVVNLVEKDSPDYQKANGELEELRAKLPTQPAAGAEEKVEKKVELSEPEPLPSPKPGFNQITLPEEEVAPEVPLKPSPSPQASPLVSPKPTVSPTP